MRRETLQARKRFAADLAERDAQRTRGRAGSSDARVDQVAKRPSGACERKSTDHRRGSGAGTLAGASSRDPLPVVRTDQQQIDDERLAYEMRRWWLDRYTLDEIRELAECLR